MTLKPVTFEKKKTFPSMQTTHYDLALGSPILHILNFWLEDIFIVGRRPDTSLGVSREILQLVKCLPLQARGLQFVP